MDRAMKRPRVLVLLHSDLVPPDSLDGYTEQQINVWKTEYDVVSTLRETGHEVRPLGVQDELKAIRDEIEDWKPDVVFNLLEQFHGETAYDQNVASYLELLRIPYTGCNPRGLMLARGGALQRQGKVSDGTSLGDAPPEARAHQMSVEPNIACVDYMGEIGRANRYAARSCHNPPAPTAVRRAQGPHNHRGRSWLGPLARPRRFSNAANPNPAMGQEGRD